MQSLLFTECMVVRDVTQYKSFFVNKSFSGSEALNESAASAD